MNFARLFVLCIGFLLFYLMFLKPDNPLFRFTLAVAGEFRQLAARLILLLRTILTGYCAYALTTLVLSLSRIETFGDIVLLLGTRPSRLGGPGLIGVVVGILFAGWVYGCTSPESLIRAWFIRGRQMGQPPNVNANNSLDRAARIRDLNKEENRKK